jgi:sugar lactone lactonase YvrE
MSVRATGGRGTYRARLVFPKPGRWRLAATAGGARFPLGSVRVLPRAPLALAEPTGIAAQPDGSLLVVEFDRHRLLRVIPSTGRVRQIAAFAKPWGVARAASGAVFVSSQNTVQRIDPGHAPVTVASVDPALEIGPVAVTPGSDVVYATVSSLYLLPGGKRGTPQQLAVSTVLAGSHGIAVASDGALLVSDTNDNRILRVDGNSVTTFASLGHPRGIDVAPDGTVYVAAADDHRIAHYSAAGVRLGFVGPRFADTYALSVAGDGTVYAIDLGGRGIIRRIAPNGTASVVTVR